MPLIPAGDHYNAMRILSPKIFPVAVELEPIAWWKGEDNPYDAMGGLPLELWDGVGLDPRYADGLKGRCFRLYSNGDYNSLTLDPQPATNITSFETWTFEADVKMTTSGRWFYLFQAYHYGGVDYVASSAEFKEGEDPYIDIYTESTPFGEAIKFHNLGLEVGNWYKIKLSYNHTTKAWRLFINGDEKTPDGSNVQAVLEHSDYTTLFFGVPWNGPLVLADEIKIFNAL